MTIPVLEKDDHLLNFKLAMKDLVNISETDAEQVFLKTEITSQEDIATVVDYLKQYRPNLYKKYVGKIH